jgi:hypothetical protein
MTRPTKREQLAVMRLEEFTAHLRKIAGEDPKAEIARRSTPTSIACASSQEGRKAEDALSQWPLLIKQRGNYISLQSSLPAACCCSA